jgi:hypothetical protein
VRLLREWEHWDDAERLVHAFELAAHLVIENTKPRQPYILECAPPASRADLSAEYLRVGEARHEELGPSDFDIRNSSIRSPGGRWLPARVSRSSNTENDHKILEYEPGATIAPAASGQAVVTSSELDKAERYTLLWDAAAEMSRANGQSVERNWLHLMDAFWCGALAPAGLTYFYPVSPGRKPVNFGRAALAGLLLNHRAVDTKKAAIDDLRHWRVDDYRNQPVPFGDYFRPDPEGRVGLAVLSGELDRWRNGTNGPTNPVTSGTLPPERGGLPDDDSPNVNPKLRAAIGNALNAHGIPGRTVPWKRFCDHVRSICESEPNVRGYGDKSIQPRPKC